MRTLVPLPEVRDNLSRREDRMWDKTVPADRMSMDPDTGDMAVTVKSSTCSYPLQHQALSLLGQKIRVPASYLRRCPPELRARNVNHWLAELGDKDLFVRFDAGEIRAVLSTRYNPVSHLEVIDQFRGDDRFKVDLDISAMKMVARLVAGDVRSRMSRDDLVLGGLSLSNSEVGYGSLELSAFLYRVVCTNGLITSEQYSFRRIHVGGNGELKKQLKDAAEHVMASLPKTLDRFKATRDALVPDPSSVFERVNLRNRLTEDEALAVEKAFERESGDRLYHVINSYTGAANDEALPIGSREKLQRVGGRILHGAERGRWLQ